MPKQGARPDNTIAVCLLHSYASGQHERTVAEWIRRDFPELDLTLSSDVAPVIREFERISTTVANAYVKPLASRYLNALEERLLALGLRSGVLMMLSNGGLCHISEAKRNPIELLESGPAAGAISAAHYGLRDDQSHLLAFDMGGTTAKLSLIEHGQPAIAFGFESARRKRFADGSARHRAKRHLVLEAGGRDLAHRCSHARMLRLPPARHITATRRSRLPAPYRSATAKTAFSLSTPYLRLSPQP